MVTKLISTACGIGYSPLAPGTAGSIFALLIYLIFPENFIFYLLGLLILFFIFVWAANKTEV